MDHLTILVPVRGRPHRVRALLDSIEANTTPPVHVLFITDPDDSDEVAAIDDADGDWFTHAGNYAQKINAGLTVTVAPLLFTGADDLNFHPGWRERAEAQLAEGIGVVGTNDLCNPRTAAGDLSTHSLVTRAYAVLQGTIDEPAKIYHEGYMHEFVDEELVQTAKARGAYAHAPDSIVEHLHWQNGKRPRDALDRDFRLRMGQGRALYRKRRPLWS